MEHSVWEQEETYGGDIFWEVIGASAGELIVTSLDLILWLLAAVLILIGCFRLYKQPHMSGARYMLASIAGYIAGMTIFLIYSFFIEEEENVLIEAISGLYFSACIAVGAYGFLKICNAIKSMNTKNSFKTDT